MKLHLPKSLFVAVLAACVAFSVAQAAGTGWSNSGPHYGVGNDKTVLYVGPNSDSNVTQTGITNISVDGNGNTIIESVSALVPYKDNANMSSFRISRDADDNTGNPKSATIQTLTVLDNSTVTVGVSGWSDKHFENLLISNLIVADSGSTSINIESGESVTLGSVDGALSSITNAGALTIGTVNGTTKLAGTITNTGALAINGSLEIASDSGFTKSTVYTGKFSKSALGEAYTSNGYAEYKSELLLIDNSGTTTISPQTITYKNQTGVQLKEKNGSTWFVDESSVGFDNVYHVNENETLAEDTASSYYVAEGATMTLAGYWSGERALDVRGNGTLVATINESNHSHALKLGNQFNGTLAVSGNMNLAAFTMGEDAKLQLTTGQVWSNQTSMTFANDIVLKSDSVDTAIDFAFNNITLSGKVCGTYLRVTKHPNAAANTFLKLTNAENDIEAIKITSRILNVEAGSVGTIYAAGGTTNIKGGNVGNLRISGGTTNITGGVSAETAIIFSTGNASSLNFKLADEAQSATYTVAEIKSVGTAAVYSANITVDSGVELNAAKINNPWGLGTITINGVLNVSETISFASGSNGNTTCNIINGSGVINTQKLELGNVGTYNFTDVTMNIGAGGITQNAQNGGNAWCLNLGDMTFGATADWVFTKPTNAGTRVNLVGSGSGTVFDTSDQTDETGKTGYTVTVSANLGGTGSLVKQGAGVLELTGENTYSGGTSIQGGTLKVSGSGTLGSGENEVQKNGTLYIAGTNAATNTALLTSTTGEGNITLGVDARLTGTDGTGQKTQVKGTLTITGDATLTIGSGDKQVNDVSSFSAVKLDNGHIYYQNKGGIINGLTVTANGGSIEVHDLGNDAAAVLLFDKTTSLSGNLKMTNTWGHKITFSKLSGAGNLVLNDNERTDNVTLTINAVEDFTGKVQIAQSATNMKLNVAENLGLGIEYGFMDGTTKRTASGHADLSAIEAGNTVSFNTFSGYVTGGDDGVVAADIVLTGNEDVAAIDWTDGSKSANLVFDGKVSGSGNIAFGKGKGHNVEFTGDISDYKGTIWGSVTGDNGNSGTSITYSGDATEINHTVASGAVNNTPGVTDVTYRYSKNVVVNGAINKAANWAGTVNIKVENDSAAENSKVTFNGDVSGKNTVNIGANAVAEFTSSNVAVSDILVQAAAQLSFTAKESMSVSRLEMQEGAEVSVSKEGAVGTLTVNTAATLAAGATVNANLKLNDGATLTINNQNNSTAAVIEGTLTLLNTDKGITLAGTVLDTLAGLQAPGSGEVILFSGVDTLEMGGHTYSVGSDVLTATSGVKLSEVFRSDSVNLDDYYIGFNANGDVYAGLIVPEPTTATLSLLALAGLCARRRRASR